MLTKILTQVPFLKGLHKKEINHILSIARERKCKSGEIIFLKQDIGNNFFIVKSGRVKIFTSIGTEKKKTFAFLKKGDFFGEMSLLGGKIRSASAQAVEPTELLVISRRNFQDLILKNADFTLKLLHTLTIRLHRANQDVESMLFHNILGRLAEAVLELSKDKHTNPVKITIDQNELAQYMGTTRVPVCRAISTLKRGKVIDYKRGQLIVLNPARLKSIAGKSI
ncbi:MAG: Crp/Fnr family transcriptional regulator [Elusimicrobia bacterium]|nr:Crp/Fnr family transcriptional regulator [Elusimicrobiota bacterium]